MSDRRELSTATRPEAVTETLADEVVLREALVQIARHDPQFAAVLFATDRRRRGSGARRRTRLLALTLVMLLVAALALYAL